MAETRRTRNVAVKFSEAIEFLRRVLAIGAEEWLRILEEEGESSSSIADETVRSVTESLAAAVRDQIEAGGNFEDFRDNYDRIVDELGWSYKGSADWHSQLIWRLWTNNAYSAGRWEQAQRLEQANPGTVYARLVTAGDHRVRDNHAQMHGIVRPIGDAYWLTHWPPNGFNCRCHPMIVTKRQLARYGWTVTPDRDPRLEVAPDPGWGFNPGVEQMRFQRSLVGAQRHAPAGEV